MLLIVICYKIYLAIYIHFIEIIHVRKGWDMKKITTYIPKYWYAYLFAITCMVISIVLDLLSPLITKSIIDDVIVKGNISIFGKLLAGIILIGVGRAIFGYLKELIFDIVSSRIASEMRRDLFDHIISLSLDFFDKTNTGELLSRVKDDIDRIWNALGFVGMLIIEVIIHTALILFFMLRQSPKLTVIPMITLPIIAAMAIIMEKKLGKIYEEISEENATLNTVAQENISGVRTVKSFAREKYEIKKFLSHNKRYYDLNMEQSRVLVKYYPYFQFVSRLLPIIIIIFGGTLVINGEISLGTLGAFAEYSANIVWPMEMLGWLTNELAAAFASSRKISKIYEEKAVIKEVEEPKHLDNISGELEFKNVSFEIDNKKVLSDISFHIKPGKTLGIMGATGSGKSSIINLLQRFYNISSGQIKLDGVDISKLSIKQLRQSISTVMQDVFLFSETVEDNIKFGRKILTNRDDIQRAVRISQARDFIEVMDKQYDTIIGERGVGLSGGQKQRISIARALVKNTPILVLDDSTSALDMETEYQIQKALSELEDTTKIIIAHRISAVRNADEIIFLENGSVAERGTHEELLSNKGLYYETYVTQYGKFTNIET